jgi:methionine synthase I (cobalamin-dependent)
LNIDAPELVREIHLDYLREGADIIISNNFFTSRSKLERIGAGDDWERYARAGARIAIEARDAVNKESYVAAGIAPPSDADIAVEFREEARVLADEGVDVLLPEFMGAVDECVAAVEACATAGLPVVLGIRRITEQGMMQYDETFDELIAALDGAPVDAILLMCCAPAHVSLGLRNLREAFDGPIGTYPHPPRWGQEDNWQLEEDVRQFADYGPEWLALGSQIVGGCCGTRPEHIAALAPLVK